MREGARSIRKRSGYHPRAVSRSRIGSEIRGNLHAETIIVGGGVIGCAIACELATRGHDVLLVERSRIAGGTSCAAAGMLAADSERFTHAVMARLAKESRELLHKQKERISSLSGVEMGLQQYGFITPFRSYSEVSNYKNNRSSNSSDEPFWWDRVSVQQEASWLNRDIYGAYYRPSESEILPVNLTQAYVRAAQAMGARVMEGVQDVRLHIDVNGVQGIRTSIGTMTSKNVIVATGLQGEELMRHAGLILPVLPVKGEIAAVHFSPRHIGYRPDKTVYADDIYIVPKANGEVWLGATSLPGRTDTKVSVQGIQKLFTAATSWVPGMKEAHFLRAWAGVRPSTPDGLPYIGACESIPGLFTAFGHYRNGILLSAITGSLMADIIYGKTSEALGIQDLSPDRMNRKEILQ
ncbi:glycine oxidase ThiO [Paenibacillus sp. JNUCC31]|uniref:glycine oxidase ThiO n=1 Tax=Paenibacillus sp. JNUCC-31 TaxID=2777983 RepID=UPI00177DF45D|nr:glycine oxidase ThiO [Paenibacillus sp. JNUCC-31]QOS79648.1 glycine oxidase ThiO [Paenibacillus sp. JNUCC-31]